MMESRVDSGKGESKSTNCVSTVKFFIRTCLQKMFTEILQSTTNCSVSSRIEKSLFLFKGELFSILSAKGGL